MKAIGRYKDMVEEVGRMLSVFAGYESNKHKEIVDLGRWTTDVINSMQVKVMNYAGIAATKIKEEIIGDGDEAKFMGRLKTAFFELGTDPNFVPSFFPCFDEALFQLPNKDNPDRNRAKLDALAAVYGSEREAKGVMVSLHTIAQWANVMVQDVAKMLDDVCSFVGYAPEPQERPQDATNTDTLAVTPEPQQETKQQRKQPRKRGRPTEPFSSKMIDDANGDKLKKMHKVLAGKKGKDFALLIWACTKKGLCNKPTYTQAKEEFGDIGSSTGYNRYLNNNNMFTQEEKDGALKSLD